MALTVAARAASRVSIRLRLVAILVAAIVLSTLVFGAVLLVTVRTVLIQRIDSQLAAGQALAQQTVVDLTRRGSTLIPSDYVVVFVLEGQPEPSVFRSQVAAVDGTPDTSQMGVSPERPRGRPYTVAGQDEGGPWRVVTYPLDSGLGSVSVALPFDADETAVSLARRTVLIGLAVAVLAALLGSWAVSRSLRPLRDVETTAAAIAAGDFSRRMPEGGQDTEVGRLTRALNGMLAHIESAIRSRERSRDRMRQFVADASHELRTPLAAIRGYAELHRQGAVPPQEVAATFQRIEGESTRLGTLVEDLLALARLDEQRPLRRDPVDLAVLAIDAAASIRALDPQRPVRVGDGNGGPVQPVVVTGDDDRLRQVLANLAGNAVAHTPPGTPVEIAVGRVGGGAAVDVVDHGPGIPAEARVRVFERFARLDASRSRGRGGGAGLGLAIVASVVDAHGGEVEVLDTPGGGATLRVRLPAGPESGPVVVPPRSPGRPAVPDTSP
ncbi:MAG: ATP-binding protein [Kineosporiaceae bacterium]